MYEQCDTSRRSAAAMSAYAEFRPLADWMGRGGGLDRSGRFIELGRLRLLAIAIAHQVLTGCARGLLVGSTARRRAKTACTHAAAHWAPHSAGGAQLGPFQPVFMGQATRHALLGGLAALHSSFRQEL